MRPVNMTTAEALSELAAARAMGMHKVAFGGGEPTIGRDLLPIARWARDRGFDWIKVSSNGLMYAYQDYASPGNRCGRDRFSHFGYGA